MVIFSDANREAEETIQESGSTHLRLLQVMMLPTLLISRKMILGGNMSCARVADGVVGAGVG
jgi:hypothetical protein